MIKVNALGDTCPIPVVKTKNAVKELGGKGTVETLVDNEIAVQNIEKMAKQKGWGFAFEKIAENEYKTVITVGEVSEAAKEAEKCAVCEPMEYGNFVVAISSEFMGNGDDKLGATLMKGFIFALTQLDKLPETILFYNGGAKITTKEGDTISDLKKLEDLGVEILTCGTCLNHYGLADKLLVGGVTNMYAIAEKLTGAGKVVKP